MSSGYFSGDSLAFSSVVPLSQLDLAALSLISSLSKVPAHSSSQALHAQAPVKRTSDFVDEKYRELVRTWNSAHRVRQSGQMVRDNAGKVEKSYLAIQTAGGGSGK